MESGTAKDTCQDPDIDVSECSSFHTAVEAFPSPEAAPALHPQHASSTPASLSQYFSPRIDAIMQNRSKCPDQVKFDIESSKVHWSTVERPYRGSSSERSSSGDEEEEDERELDEEVLQANRAAMEDQKGHPMWGKLFQEERDRVYEKGEKIGKGGQAEIYAGICTDKPEDRPGRHVVFKVFRKGTCLEDLIKQWPEGAFRDDIMLRSWVPEYKFEEDQSTSWMMAVVRESFPQHEIEHVMILPDDGRIAMVMERAIGDLRWLIDLEKQANHNQGPPFDLNTTVVLMRKIAHQMMVLRCVDVVHKDLKASNILIGSFAGFNPGTTFEDIQFDVMRRHVPLIADYECANGVMGTGFWRAPELLLAIRDRTYSPSVVTTKSDVYSYGMLCYEIATGFLPFEREGFETKVDIDCVINGQRPTFPDDVDWKVKELISSCWHKDENQRPTFEEIHNRFHLNWETDMWELK